jgi:organic hydroperoxide reductase OsmC/OhrA
MAHDHHYSLTTQWTGNTGKGTSSYTAYSRNHTIQAPGKPTLHGSSDPAFRGDRDRYNPEELLLAALSSCHMLWYLHFCSEAGVIVTAYSDEAVAVMTEDSRGNGKFTGATLRPHVTVAEASMTEKAQSLHKKAREYCFIANSVNFPVAHEPACTVQHSA